MNIKSILIFTLLTVCLSFIITFFVISNDFVIEANWGEIGNVEIPPGYGPTDPKAFTGQVVELLFKIAGTLLVIVLLYGGVLYVSSVGKEEQIKKAQNTIKFAILGIVVVLMAYYIVELVVGLLT